MIEKIPYIIIAMLIYDFSAHLVYFLKVDGWIIKKKLNWWLNWKGINTRYFG